MFGKDCGDRLEQADNSKWSSGLFLRHLHRTVDSLNRFAKHTYIVGKRDGVKAVPECPCQPQKIFNVQMRRTENRRPALVLQSDPSDW